MTAVVLGAFAGGVISHKCWRVAWRVYRHPVSLRDAVADEFAPPEPEGADRKRARTISVTERA